MSTVLYYLACTALGACAYAAFWPIVAWFVATTRIFRALQARAFKTPYWHLEGYMERWWLFNPIKTSYVQDNPALNTVRVVKSAKYPWCPVSIRMHHILRADLARDPHNHPGSFRTIIGQGWYFESRERGPRKLRARGDTSVLRHGEFHHVDQVSPGGVWTIFIMWNWQTTWGFKLADGTVVDHREYKDGGAS